MRWTLLTAPALSTATSNLRIFSSLSVDTRKCSISGSRKVIPRGSGMMAAGGMSQATIDSEEHFESSGVVLDSILNRIPVVPQRLNPDLPPKLDEIISKCLEKDRTVRYQHASDIRTDLQRLKRDTDSGRLVSSGVKVGGPRSRRMIWGIAAAIVVLVGIGFLAWRVFYSAAPASDGVSIHSMAALPFANASKDPELDYLGEGLSEEI